MQAEQSILDRIQRSQLKWYGHLLRMENSCTNKIYQWTPHGRRRRGRPSDGLHEKQKPGIKHLWRLGLDRRLLAV